MDPTEALERTGYAVFPALYDEDFLVRARAEVLRIYAQLGHPELNCRGKQDMPSAHAVLSGAGLMIGQLLGQAPSLATGYIHPQLREALVAALGPAPRLETTAATISDHSRKLLGWHNHIGGLDEDLERPVDYETLDDTRIRRVTLLVYLDGIMPELGELVVAPRTLADPIPCPYDEHEYEPGLAGTRQVSGPPGTAVLLEERLWHAALSRQTPGYRRFVGAMVAAAWAPPSDNIDPSASAFQAELLG